MDKTLQAIAAAADDGERVGLALLTQDGGIFEGFTDSPEALFDESEEPLQREVAERLAGGRARHVPRHLEQARSEVQPVLERLRSRAAPDVDAVTLVPAHWTPQHGQYVVRLPVARIPLSGVTAWWLVGGEVTEEVRQGGSWFVGGFFSSQ